MRLVCLNAWGGALWPDLSAWLPGCEADILCVQEVIRATEPSPEWLVYQDANRTLNQRANLVADISRLLPGHQAYFAPAARGPLLDGDETYRSEHGLGLWTASELAVVEVHQRMVFGTFRSDGWGSEPVPRAIQGALVFDPVSGRAVFVVNLHGLRDPSGKGDTPDRDEQARTLIGFLDQFASPDEPVIVAGDFNVLPVSATLRVLVEWGLHDLIAAHGITDTRTTIYKKPQRYADYVLATSSVRVTGFSAPPEPVVSDHRPLILDFAF